MTTTETPREDVQYVLSILKKAVTGVWETDTPGKKEAHARWAKQIGEAIDKCAEAKVRNLSTLSPLDEAAYGFYLASELAMGFTGKQWDELDPDDQAKWRAVAREHFRKMWAKAKSDRNGCRHLHLNDRQASCVHCELITECETLAETPDAE